jgi:multidrug efflux pump subunit AcrB
MSARPALILAAAGVWLVGCVEPDAAPKAGPVVVVTASYPGASAPVVADTVAAPIEQQLNGADGMVRLESESHNDGRYVARLRFTANTDPKAAAGRVEARVAHAKALLPQEVQRTGIAVKSGTADDDRGKVVIALIDRHDRGRAALQTWAAAVAKRLGAEGALREPVLYPVDEKQLAVRVDRAKCARRGVAVSDLNDVLQLVGPATGTVKQRIRTLEALKIRSAGGKMVPVVELAEIAEVTAPAAVYRVNLHPAIRVTGTPPAGRAPAEAAARCIDLAHAEPPGIGPNGFAAEDLSAR